MISYLCYGINICTLKTFSLDINYLFNERKKERERGRRCSATIHCSWSFLRMWFGTKRPTGGHFHTQVVTPSARRVLPTWMRTPWNASSYLSAAASTMMSYRQAGWSKTTVGEHGTFSPNFLISNSVSCILI